MGNRVSAEGHSRRVHLALGVAAEQANCSIERALALITNTAEIIGSTLEEVADEVLDGTIRYDL